VCISSGYRKERGLVSRLDHLLLNVLIIWACIFLYQVLWLDRPHYDEKRNKFVFTGLLSMGLFACMCFPARLLPEYPFDLHGVLLLIGYLYGGISVGLVLSGIMLTFQLVQDSSSMELILANLVFVLTLFSVTVRRYAMLSISRKLFAAMLIASGSAALLTIVAYALALNDGIEVKMVSLLKILGYCLVYGTSASLSVYLIEKIRENSTRQAEYQQREKMQMLGELAAAVAHEIRNPMTVARGFVQHMKGNEAAASRFHDYAPMIIEELDRAEAVISDYLTFAKPHEGKAERLDLGEQLTHVVAIMTPYATLYGVEIQTYWQTSLKIIFDRKQWRQLLIHLMKNGIEAMPEGGKLDVELCQEEGDSVIRIRDTGIGMHQEELKRLGSLFYSTKTKGTGMGLMICYRIVETAGGTLHVESEKGKGTMVTLRLPLCDE
jgi:two-component system sporulation sensor kinase B